MEGLSIYETFLLRGADIWIKIFYAYVENLRGIYGISFVCSHRALHECFHHTDSNSSFRRGELIIVMEGLSIYETFLLRGADIWIKIFYAYVENLRGEYMEFLSNLFRLRITSCSPRMFSLH